MQFALGIVLVLTISCVSATPRCSKESGIARIAVGFFGMSKSLWATLYTFEKYVFKELEARNISYDVFWSTMVATEAVASRGNNHSLGAIDPFEVRLMNPCQISLLNQAVTRLHEFNTFVKSYNATGENARQDVFEDNFVSVKNALCAYHSQSVLASMISAYEETHNFKYDAVLALRPDTAIMRPIDLPDNLNQIRSENNTIWLPSFQPWGGYNDRAAYGSREVMSIYLNRGNAFRDGKYSPQTISERLVKRMVNEHNMKVEMSSIRVLRVRQNGLVGEPGRDKTMNVTEAEFYRCVDRVKIYLTKNC